MTDPIELCIRKKASDAGACPAQCEYCKTSQALGTVTSASAEPPSLASDPHDALTFHAIGGIGDVNSDAKGSGARYNAGKTPLELVPLTQVAESYLRGGGMSREQHEAAEALRFIGQFQSRERGIDALYDALGVLGLDGWKDCAEVFDYGQRKYKAWNWAKGMAWSIPIACAARHIMFGILAGEHDDPESLKPHRGHVYCNVVMLIAFTQVFAEGDDRPAPGLLASIEDSTK